MTGAYLRIKRDGIMQNIEIEYLTTEELVEQFQHRDSPELVRWLKMLCNTIVGYEETLNQLVHHE